MFCAKFIALSVFVAAVSAQTPPFSGKAYLEPGSGTSYCLTASGTDNRAAVDIQKCDGHADQQWTFTGGTVNIFNGTKCLDVTNGANADGTLLQIWDCVAYNTNQQWYYTGDNR